MLRLKSFQILEDAKYGCIEKIKTIGYTYMAASGLTPETNYSDLSHVIALTEYVFAIRDQLRSVNEHSFNNFKMRIGKLCNFQKLSRGFYFGETLQIAKFHGNKTIA